MKKKNLKFKKYLKSKNIDEHTIGTINDYPELFKSLEATLNFNLG